jgi:polyferredoxin
VGRAEHLNMGQHAATLALADGVLLLHFGVVLFVVGGLLFTWWGVARGMAVVRRWPFRLAHAAAIAVVVAQAWLGITCPLTTLENWLRVQGGGVGYERSFIEAWVSRLMYFEAPSWVFALAYTGFGALVFFTWWRWPPGSSANTSVSGRL